MNSEERDRRSTGWLAALKHVKKRFDVFVKKAHNARTVGPKSGQRMSIEDAD